VDKDIMREEIMERQYFLVAALLRRVLCVSAVSLSTLSTLNLGCN
jgi:hypothetical protein